MPFTDEQIEDMFTYHNDASKIPNYAAIREAGKALAKVIRDNTKPCADQSAAIRLARNAVMTANAAVALDGRY